MFNLVSYGDFNAVIKRHRSDRLLAYLCFPLASLGFKTLTLSFFGYCLNDKIICKKVIQIKVYHPIFRLGFQVYIQPLLPLDQSSGRGRPSCAGSSCSSPPGQRGARAGLRFMVQQHYKNSDETGYSSITSTTMRQGTAALQVLR